MMARSEYWHKAVVVSLLLHGLLLIGGGWLNVSYTAAQPEEQYTELALDSDIPETDAIINAGAEMVSAAPAEAAAEDAVPKVQSPPPAAGALPPSPHTASITMKSEDIPAQMLLHYSQEQLNLALAQYNQALSLDTRLASAYSNRGQVYYDKGQFDKALSDFSQALAINPKLILAYVGRGFIYIKKGEWDLAADSFNQAVLLAPQNDLAHYGRALCFVKDGDKEKAIEEFHAFLRLAKPGYKKLLQSAERMLAELEKADPSQE